MEIYVLINNQPQGPYTRELVHKYLKSGALKATDLAAYAGSSDWKPLSTMVQSWSGASTKRAAPSGVAPSTRRKLTVAIVAGTGAVLVAAGAVFWLGNRKSTRSVAGTSSRNFPKSLAELNDWYVEPPAGQNAATFYVKGLDALEVSQVDQNSTDLPVLGRGSMPELGQPISPRAKAAITALVQKNEAAWKSLQEGAGFEQARYPMDLNLGADTLLPHLAKIKRAAQFTQLRAILAADNKQPQEAVDSILLSLAVAQSLKNEPVLISQLVRVAANAIDVVSLEYTLNSVALSPADLERLSAAFAKAESENSEGTAFTRALVAERVSAIAFLDLPPEKMEAQLGRNENVNDGSPKIPVSRMIKDLKSQRAFFAETFDHALGMRSEAFPQRLKQDEYITSRIGEAKARELFLCQTWLAGLGKVTAREARGLSNLRLAQAAIALERFRQESGAYPDSLGALVPKFLPQVPQDPTNGAKIHYQKSGAGYEVTSTAINAPRPASIKVINPPKLP
jgi:hypothetical protein